MPLFGLYDQSRNAPNNLVGVYDTFRQATTAANEWNERNGGDKWDLLVIAQLPELNEEAHIHSRRKIVLHNMWVFTHTGEVKRSSFAY